MPKSSYRIITLFSISSDYELPVTELYSSAVENN